MRLKTFYIIYLVMIMMSGLHLNAQTIFWTEDFGTGCNDGTLAQGHVTVNGTWTMTSGVNGAKANTWYISASENGNAVGACGTGCGTNQTLHLGPVAYPLFGITADGGARYYAGGVQPSNTDRRIESPTINCSGRTSITLRFRYMENGEGTNDDASVWYYDGSTWSQLSNPAKTALTCDPQGTWTAYSYSMPASADNNANVKIGFRWINDDNMNGFDPSFAVDNIGLEVPASALPVANFSSGDTTICVGSCINFTDLTTNSPTSWNWTFNGATPGTSTVQNPSNICFNTAGNYTITLVATNLSGSDTETKTDFIIVVANPTATITPATATICAGQSQTLTASGGTGYLWSTSANTAAITVSPSTTTTYTVTVTNAAGCTDTESRTVTVNALPTATIAPASATICAGQSQTLTAGGGTGFLWSTSANTAAITVSPASTTTYSVTVTDASGCTDTELATVTVNSLPTAVISPGSPSICEGQSQILTASGGTSYLWDTGETTDVISVTPVATTSYIVTVTIGTGCSDTETVTVTVNSLPVASISPANPSICVGQSQTLTATGGTSYLWNTSETSDIISVNPTVTSSYFVTVTNAAGCSDTETVSVIVNDLPVVSISGLNSPYCGVSDPIILTGNHAPGGTFTGTDISDNGDGTAIYYQSVFGTYTITYTYTDLNGCTASDIQTVTVNPLPSVSFSGLNSPYCQGDLLISLTGNHAPSGTFTPSIIDNGNGTASIDPTFSGTYNITYTYSDGNGCTASSVQQLVINELPFVSTLLITDVTVCSAPYNGGIVITAGGGAGQYDYSIDSGPFSPMNNFTGLDAATHTISILDTNGCSIDTAVTINSIIGFQIDSLAAINVLCNGDTSGQLVIYAAGGVNYSIDNGISFFASSNFFNLPAGTYNIIAEDAGNCTDTSIATINEPQQLILTPTGTNVSCGGNNGSAEVSLSGGVGPYTYLWSNDSTTNIISYLNTGDYFVTVTDNNGCTAVSSITLINTGGSLSTDMINITQVDCNGNSTGSATVQVTGTAPFTYYWSNSDTTATIDSIGIGQYFVTVADNFGCFGYDTLNITEPPAIMISDSITPSVCGAPDGSIEVYVSGGTPGYYYNWGGYPSTLPVIAGLIEGTYYLTITDSNGCAAEHSYYVPNSAGNLTTGIINISDADCYGNSTGSAEVTVSGTGPFYYYWSNGDTTAFVDSIPAGIYFVTVSDSSGCFGIDSLIITQPNALAFTDSIVNISCYGYNNGQIFLTTTGGTPSYFYQWAGPLSFTSTDEDISGLNSGGYYVTITDANGCSVAGIEFSITGPEKEVSAIISYNSPTCYSSSDGIAIANVTGGTPPYSYFWSNGGSGTSVTNLSSGEYYLTVIDGNSCLKIDTFSVIAPDSLSAVESITDVSCAGNNDATITLITSGGTKPYNYIWNTDPVQNDSSAINLTAGDYSVTISDFNNCTEVINYSVSEEPEACLNIPNVFTPNGDGVNDTWELSGIQIYSEVKIEIFNRWGDIIFSYEGTGSGYHSNPWDGKYKREEIPISSYIYIVDLKNGNEPYNGIVTIKK